MPMSNTDEKGTSQNTTDQSTNQSSSLETVVATSYLPQSQYQQWEREASKRNQSISEFISSMVQAGMNDIQLDEGSQSDIIELREQLRQVRAERDEARKEKQNLDQEAYHIGLGKVKELIINNPGIERRELVNYLVENPVIFVDMYLNSLEATEFVNKGGNWYPPEGVCDTQ